MLKRSVRFFCNAGVSDLTSALSSLNRSSPDSKKLLPLLEAMREKSHSIPTWAMSQAAQLGRQAHLSEAVVKLFLAGYNSPSLRKLCLFDNAVDCAYDTGYSSHILALVRGAMSKLTSDQDDIVSQLALCRALWRAVLLSVKNPKETFEHRKAAFYLLSIVRNVVPFVLSSTNEQSDSSNIPTKDCRESFLGNRLASTLPNDDEVVVSSISRFCRYGTIDEGECSFYHYLYSHFLIFCPVSPALSHVTLTLLRSCERLRNSTLATEYYTAYCRKRSINDEEVDEAIWVSWGHTLNADGKSETVLDTAARILSRRPEYVPSQGVVSTISRATHKTRNVSLIRVVLERLTTVDLLKETVEVKALRQTVRQSTHICLHMLARFGVLDFETILNECVEKGMIDSDANSLLARLLTWTMNTVNPSEQLSKFEPLLEDLRSINEDVAGALLQVYSRVQHDRLYNFYCTLQERNMRKLPWFISLLEWAEARRYSIESSMVRFISEEAKNFDVQKIQIYRNVNSESVLRGLEERITETQAHTNTILTRSKQNVQTVEKEFEDKIRTDLGNEHCVRFERLRHASLHDPKRISRYEYNEYYVKMPYLRDESSRNRETSAPYDSLQFRDIFLRNFDACMQISYLRSLLHESVRRMQYKKLRLDAEALSLILDTGISMKPSTEAQLGFRLPAISS